MSFNLAADVGAFHTTCVEKEQELAAARRRTAEARAAVEKGEVSERKRGDGRPCVGKGGMDSLTHSLTSAPDIPRQSVVSEWEDKENKLGETVVTLSAELDDVAKHLDGIQVR